MYRIEFKALYQGPVRFTYFINLLHSFVRHKRT